MVTRRDKSDLELRLTELLEPVMQEQNFELVDIECKQGKRMILRIFIDRLNGDRAVSIDDCAEVSRIIGPILDVEDVILSSYVLEVSSPGVERPLIKPEHFQRFTGKRVKIVTQGLVSGRSVWHGILTAAGSEKCTLVADCGTVDIPYRSIARANLEFRFEDHKH